MHMFYAFVNNFISVIVLVIFIFNLKQTKQILVLVNKSTSSVIVFSNILF